MSVFSKITASLAKTRERLAQGFQEIFQPGLKEKERMELLEEALLLADVGPATTGEIIHGLAGIPAEELLTALKTKLLAMLQEVTPSPDRRVVVFVGVNGSGKTTSVGKFALSHTQRGHKVVVIGADTFRAAADRQLEVWCERAGAQKIIGGSGSDPAAVVFDGLHSAAAKAADLIICDTAGRLHSNKNLMRELEKIIRVAARESGEEPEVLLILDASTGQNALDQFAIFSQWVKPTGIVLTKLDGTARGGVAIALTHKYGVPVKYIGVGEGPGDFLPFDAQAYVEALLPQQN